VIKIPYSKKAKYYHNRQQDLDDFVKGSLRTVPLHHSGYKGDKYKEWNKKGSGAKAIVGKKKKTKKWATQSILIPKK